VGILLQAVDAQQHLLLLTHSQDLCQFAALWLPQHLQQ
jgi:hypothetical protein